MAGNFDIAKFLKENSLGSFGILGKYVDLHGLNEAEDIDGLKLVKGSGTLRTRGEAEAIAKVAKDSGMTGVKIIEKGPKHFSVYADPEKSLKKEADEMDGGGENPWMEDVDGTEAYTVGNWKCYYDYPGHLVWSYGDTPFDKLAVYATPDFDGDGTTPIQIEVNGSTSDQMTLKQSEFADFNEYANAMKPYLDRIENLESNWGSLAELGKPTNDSEGEPEGDQYDGKYDDEFGPAIANEAEDSFIQAQRDAASDFESEDHNRMMGLIDTDLESKLPTLNKIVKAARAKGLSDQAIFNMLSTNSMTKASIDSLIADGFDYQDIIDFFATDFGIAEEVSVSSSGVEMEEQANPADEEGKYQYPMAEFGEAVYKASQAGITKETLHKLVDWNAE